MVFVLFYLFHDSDLSLFDLWSNVPQNAQILAVVFDVAPAINAYSVFFQIYTYIMIKTELFFYLTLRVKLTHQGFLC